MATFPSLDRRRTNDRQPDNGLSIVIAPYGGLFGQSLYADNYWIFNPVFTKLSEADTQTLQAFYDTNKLLAFDFVYTDRGKADITYECNFLNEGVIYHPDETGFYIAQAFFRGRIKP